MKNQAVQSMRSAMVYAFLFIMFVAGGLAGWAIRGIGTGRHVEPVIEKDTLVVRDTTFFERPVPVPQPYPVYLKPDTIRFVTTLRDTLLVPVPMEQKHYSDSTYDAWLSGYKPSLDSLRIYSDTKIITITKTEQVAKSKPWGIGFQLGGTYVPQKGVSPYVGIGVSYNIFSF